MKGARAEGVDEGYDERRGSALAERALPPVQAKAAVDLGYGDLIAAARALPARAPVQAARSPVVEEDEEAHSRGAIAQRATQPGEAKAAFDFGYGDLIAAARAPVPYRQDATGMPAPVQAKMEGPPAAAHRRRDDEGLLPLASGMSGGDAAAGAAKSDEPVSRVGAGSGYESLGGLSRPSSPAGLVQAKLMVGRPGDAYEQQADRMADAAVDAVGSRSMQQEEESELPLAEQVTRRASLASPPATPTDEPTVRRRPGPGSERVGGNLEKDLAASKGRGSRLPQHVAQSMGDSLGADFSDVTIHTDSKATEMSRDLGAHAFTYGSDIYFDAGKYDPTSTSGQHLLAHELAHTIQQGGSAVNPKERAAPRTSATAATDAPKVQAAWYNFDIPFTNYQFDPSIEGLKTAAGVAKDTVVSGAEQVGDAVASGFEWVVDQIKGLIDAGITWLTDKFSDIKSFAANAYDQLREGLSGLLSFVTAPAATLQGAFAAFNSNAIASAWNALRNGASQIAAGFKTVISGVLSVGERLWETASGYADTLFSSVGALMDNWAFQQLPEFLQKKARGLLAQIRARWETIRDYTTGVLRSLRSFTNEILGSVDAFLQNVLAFAIDTVVATVKTIKEVWDWVTELASAPEQILDSLVASITAKLDSEAPSKASAVAREKLDEAGGAGAAPAGRVQRQSSGQAPRRSTTSRDDANKGIEQALSTAWANLNIADMLKKSIVTMVWPPATIRAIGHEFYELVMTDWANAVSGFFVPRTESIGAFFHDLWSNFLVLLDFPLALWRRLNTVAMSLLFWVTIALVVVGAVGGAIAGGGALSIPGALAGAAAGFQLGMAIGEAAVWSFIGAESVTAVKLIVDLLTARQTEQEKNRDYVQIAASVIGIAVALVLLLIIWALGELLGAIVSRIKGKAGPEPKAPPEPEPKAPPEPEPKAPPEPEPKAPPEPEPKAPPEPEPKAPPEPEPKAPPEPEPKAPPEPEPQPQPQPGPDPQPQPRPEVTWAELEPQVRARLNGKVEPKIIDKMIETMQNSGDAGKLLGDRIANGQFKGVEGYLDLIKKASIDKHSIEAINQAMDRASQLVRDGVPEEQLRFEHDKGTGFFDVDVGVRNPGTPDTYLQAYQFKTLDGKLTPKKIQEAALQLKDVNAAEKILEFRCTPETTPDVIADPKIIGEMRFQAGLKVPGKGNGITEFRFELSDGTVIVKTKANLGTSGP